MTAPASEQSVFLHAIGLGSAAERAAYLDDVCRDNPGLRGEVDALLAAHDRLDARAVGVATVTSGGPAPTAAYDPPAPEAGAVIGPYKLVEPIGEGGMGAVWMAQQTEPVRRLVALKLIKAGMESKQVVARFEAERQALALMDHPNIARVLDGGTTGAGRPYFVMDLVKGVPITTYCDDHRLTPRQRLELFLPVCQAVQHAHQKGVIHRDLKPSNVLVALCDGKPVPKVIDFGIAKAAGQQLTDKTLVTGFGALVGTPEYMSPEQAEVNQLDIDTRSDIYSLGVLLYELLAGSPPFSRKDLERAGLLEMLRVVREQEPSKPSTKLSTAEGLPTLAANRGTEPAKLARLVRGELDWIVIKAIEKDRSRRYETANGFAADVLRYLADEPVQASPPSTTYRLKKFARRNRRSLVTAGLLTLALVVAVGGVAGSIGWAARDRAARQARATGQVDSILADVDRLVKDQRWAEALAVARRADAVASGGEADAAVTQRAHERLKNLVFIDRLEQVRMKRATMVEGKIEPERADRNYAQAFRDYGVDVDSLGVEESIERLKAHASFASPIAAALDDWWDVRIRLQNSKQSSGWKRLVAVARGIDADPVRDRLRSIWERPPADALAGLRGLAEPMDISAQPPATIVMLANGLRRGSRSDREVAERVLRAAQIVHPGDYWINFDLAYVLFEQTDWEGAIRFYTAAISIRPDSAVAHNNIGLAEKRHLKPHEPLIGGVEKATGRFRRAVEIDSKFADPYVNLGEALSSWEEKWSEAEASYRKAIELDPTLASAHEKLGQLLMSRDQVAEAIVHFQAAIRLDPNDFGPHLWLGNAREVQGWPEAALARYRKASEIGSRSAADHRLIADFLLRMRDLDRAIFHYRRAAEGLHNPMEKSAAYYHLGNAQVHNGRLDDAIESFRLCMKIGPKSQLPARLAQIMANSQKRYDPAGAQRIAEALIRFTPREEPHGLGLAWQALAWARYRLGDYTGAIVAINRVKDLGSPGDSYEWFLLALAHQQLGNRKEAREWYEKAVEWMNKNAGQDYELRLFRGEARELFGDPAVYEVTPPPRPKS